MEKIFNLTSTFKALDEDDSGVHITGYASTKDFDRAGDINTICSVSLAEADFGQTASYQAQDGNGTIIKYTTPKSITSIDISLVDKFGFPLKLGASCKLP